MKLSQAYIAQSPLLENAERCDETQFGYICVFLQVERQRHSHFGFNASTVRFAITLR
jgi:hypothetical protein